MDDQILSLIKFCSVETGLKILNSQSLRWSAPHLFNDPFELDYRSATDFDQEKLTNGLIKEAISLLFGPTEPRGKSNRLVAAIARWRDEDRFASEEEAETVLAQLIGQLAEQQQEQIESYLLKWQQFARSLRICCFCDKPGNITAWQRFADNHAGIALKFATGDGTALTNPRKMSYSTTPPHTTSLAEQVAIGYGKEQPPSANNFMEKVLSKNRDDSNEREWRCFDTEQAEGDDDQLWYTDKAFKAAELKGIYLGLTIPPEDRLKIVEAVKRDFKNTRIFETRTVPGKYEIDFVQVES